MLDPTEFPNDKFNGYLTWLIESIRHGCPTDPSQRMAVTFLLLGVDDQGQVMESQIFPPQEEWHEEDARLRFMRYFGQGLARWSDVSLRGIVAATEVVYEGQEDVSEIVVVGCMMDGRLNFAQLPVELTEDGSRSVGDPSMLVLCGDPPTHDDTSSFLKPMLLQPDLPVVIVLEALTTLMRSYREWVGRPGSTRQRVPAPAGDREMLH